tara:strand:- start:96 stop:359 length:264 start_codon:yes stop_codon:yes gene_type:complete
MSPLGEFLILIISFTGIILYYSVKQFEESKSSKSINPNTKTMNNTNTKTIEKEKIVAEKLNGRFAMMGFIALIGAYLTTGQIIPGFV